MTFSLKNFETSSKQSESVEPVCPTWLEIFHCKAILIIGLNTAVVKAWTRLGHWHNYRSWSNCTKEIYPCTYTINCHISILDFNQILISHKIWVNDLWSFTVSRYSLLDHHFCRALIRLHMGVLICADRACPFGRNTSCYTRFCARFSSSTGNLARLFAWWLRPSSTCTLI